MYLSVLVHLVLYCTVFFFFQAEDGIRDYKVTGVQTCALPIFRGNVPVAQWLHQVDPEAIGIARRTEHYRPMTRVRALAAVLACLAVLASGFMKIGRASCRERV